MASAPIDSRSKPFSPTPPLPSWPGGVSLSTLPWGPSPASPDSTAVFGPPAQPTHLPILEPAAQRYFVAQAKVFRFHLHVLSATPLVHTFMPLRSWNGKSNVRALAPRGLPARFAAAAMPSPSCELQFEYMLGAALFRRTGSILVPGQRLRWRI
jgi:hypothetical protein